MLESGHCLVQISRMHLLVIFCLIEKSLSRVEGANREYHLHGTPNSNPKLLFNVDAVAKGKLGPADINGVLENDFVILITFS